MVYSYTSRAFARAVCYNCYHTEWISRDPAQNHLQIKTLYLLLQLLPT
jgi:hypothetical protein